MVFHPSGEKPMFQFYMQNKNYKYFLSRQGTQGPIFNDIHAKEINKELNLKKTETAGDRSPRMCETERQLSKLKKMY